MLRIGIDLGGTKIEGVVMQPDGGIAARIRRPTPANAGYQAIIGAVSELVMDLEKQAGEACQVGIGTPGALSSRDRTLKNSNTVCMNGKPLLRDLQSALGREIRLENDANCFTLSEAVDGAGQRYKTVFGIIMGTGVGGGIVFDKQLHSGPQHIAGEWGHNVLDPGGPDCYCGKQGCVETFLSGPGLVAMWRSAGGEAACNSADIVNRAAQQDALAQDVMAQYHVCFGRAIAMVVNILDPDVIVLGGGMSNIQTLYNQGRARVASYVFNDELRTVIVPNLHGDSSGVRGAANLWPSPLGR